MLFLLWETVLPARLGATVGQYWRSLRGGRTKVSRSTHRPADGSSPTAITRYPGRLTKVLAALRYEPIRSAMPRGSFAVRVSRQHESQQIHGPPTSYDTGPDFTRNREEPAKNVVPTPRHTTPVALKKRRRSRWCLAVPLRAVATNDRSHMRALRH